MVDRERELVCGKLAFFLVQSPLTLKSDFKVSGDFSKKARMGYTVITAMNFNEYQKKAKVTALYPRHGTGEFVYPTLGLVGEAGEVADKIKKIIRDDGGKISDDKKQEIKKELGDVLWYVSQLASELGISLEDIASLNIEKLYSRLERGKLSGSGDNR